MVWPKAAREKNQFKKGKPGGPGRKKMTPEQKIEAKAYKAHLKEYLTNGQAATDFQKARRKNPLGALQEAADRTFGKATQKIEGDMGLGVIQIVHGDKKK